MTDTPPFAPSAQLPPGRQSWPERLASRRPLIMGILNVTPDSFADQGRFFDPDAALAQARNLVAAGADILDVGGESTRPFAEPLPLEEELRRVIPVIRAMAPKIPIPISIDTYKAPVARAALAAGASIINDISALRFDPEMAPLAAASGVAVILMHMQGTPRDMQRRPHYHDLLGEITAFFRERLEFAESRGIPRELLVLDPGLGFGKTWEHNLEILRQLEVFLKLGCPLLVGPSRKAFIGRITGLPAGPERDVATLAALAAAVQGGARIVRTHNVAYARQFFAVWEAIYPNNF
ncbi:MAG: dihydropteroate synthase [Desulfobaccales bacterium]